MYSHKVQYYETDMMGIVHHSNYVRWMEEARIDFLKRIGTDYDLLEAAGVISPITEIECKYISSTRFPEEIFIQVEILDFTGLRIQLKYIMTNADGVRVFEGKSENCFVDKNLKPLRLKRDYPQIHEKIQRAFLQVSAAE